MDSSFEPPSPEENRPDRTSNYAQSWRMQTVDETVDDSYRYGDDEESQYTQQGDTTSLDLFRAKNTSFFLDQTLTDDTTTTTLTSTNDFSQNGSMQSSRDKLTKDFWETYCDQSNDEFKSAGKMFNIVKGHIETLSKKAPLLPKVKQVEVAREISQLKQERNTWRLLETVLEDHCRTQPDMDQMDEDEPHNISEWTDRMRIDHLFVVNGDLRQSQFVVEWLEESAKFEFDEFIGLSNYESADVCWRSTMEQISSGRAGRAASVFTMDPDAPMRNGGKLADQDEEDDTRLLKKVFALIRIGDINKAQKLCEQAGQPWRAATMDGWRLWHDRKAAAILGVVDESEETEGHVGNFFRDVWKANCWEISEQDGYHLHERAIYAALSGNLRQLLKVCHSWEDALWAHFRVLVDRCVEKELRERPLQYRSTLAELPAMYNDTNLDPKDIFDGLNASPIETIQKGATEPFHKIQSWLILFCVDNRSLDHDTTYLDAIIDYLHQLASPGITAPAAEKKQHLRFFAHVIIFLRDVQLLERDERACTSEDSLRRWRHSNDVIYAYVSYLIEQKQPTHYEFIAKYTAELSAATQVQCYAQFLNDIKDTDTRRRCLQYADDAGLEVSKITKEVVENMTKTRDDNIDESMVTLAVSSQGLDLKISKNDQMKIQSIEWLTFHESDRLEALVQSNAVMREFLAARKMHAAQEVLLKLPPDSVEVIQTLFEAEYDGDDDKLRLLDATLLEHIGIKAYVEANDAFEAWHRCFSEDRPVLTGASSNETTQVQRFMQQESDQIAFERRQQRWHEQCIRMGEDVELKTLNALQSAEGWFADFKDDRSGQLRLLRKHCIPALLIHLHRVLHDSGKFQECIKIADLIAADPKLVEVFRECKQELRDILKAIRRSSMELLKQNPDLDALGYPIASLEPAMHM
eukprot:m.192200 g.192200  ORF g.192200 m.192200 type:complete len:919 (-) comp32455_c1_seq1:40-2796(-)